jgi:hypothetical protein
MPLGRVGVMKLVCARTPRSILRAGGFILHVSLAESGGPSTPVAGEPLTVLRHGVEG